MFAYFSSLHDELTTAQSSLWMHQFYVLLKLEYRLSFSFLHLLAVLVQSALLGSWLLTQD